PLGALIIQYFFGRRLPRQGDWLSTGAMGLSLLCSIIVFIQVIFVQNDPHYLFQTSYAWFSGGDLQFTWGFHIDNLTAVMLMVVGVISFVVHVYSIGYMHGEDFYDRFFAYLSLFSFSMLLLVLCDNLIVLYISWELVGVSSYLLIGFYFWKDSAADACKKAFITTRVGDIFMLIGVMIVVLYIGKINYREVFDAAAQGQLSGWTLSVAAVCLFGGAVGKSAQFPLHVWLPDAMEGPTPVSALIHAATMVAAGVYMVGRLLPIFSASPEAMLVIAYIGLITAFFAATIAITQTDIKRILAYSTISQLGYMMTALGVGAYTAGLYHLMTHAFFKALLFLCSGCVIHAVHTNEITQMGGLGKKLPVTALTMLIGALAISGIPFFSGFGSKDAILAGALQFGVDHPQHFLIFLGLLVGAGITAFYMFRLIFLTFFGDPREPERFEHAQEAPATMTIPLMILALLSILGGWGLYGGLWFNHLVVPPVLGEAAQEAAHAGAHHGSAFVHYGAMVLSLIFAFTGLIYSYLVYYKKSISAAKMAKKYSFLYQLSYHKYWIDELYEKTVIAFVMNLRLKVRDFDDKVVDGAVNATAPALIGASRFSGAFDKYVVDGLV
ncbi:MAG: NADH-quinone oxidoreductase subunit L, partial [Candidatus Hinthialibacter sp.]